MCKADGFPAEERPGQRIKIRQAYLDKSSVQTIDACTCGKRSCEAGATSVLLHLAHDWKRLVLGVRGVPAESESILQFQAE